MKSYMLSFVILTTGLIATLGFSEQVSKPPGRRLSVQGDQFPELIPNFLVWRAFFNHVDTFYRHDALNYYLKKRVGLGKIHRYDSVHEPSKQIIANHGTWFTREADRLSTKRSDMRRSIESRFRMELGEFEQRQLELIQEEVNQLRKICNSLRDALVTFDPDLGSDIWNEIVRFINTDGKKGISYSSDETPYDLAIGRIWGEFEAELIPKKPR